MATCRDTTWRQHVQELGGCECIRVTILRALGIWASHLADAEEQPYMARTIYNILGRLPKVHHGHSLHSKSDQAHAYTHARARAHTHSHSPLCAHRGRGRCFMIERSWHDSICLRTPACLHGLALLRKTDKAYQRRGFRRSEKEGQ